jgi:hypothetical protein
MWPGPEKTVAEKTVSRDLVGQAMVFRKKVFC